MSLFDWQMKIVSERKYYSVGLRKCRVLHYRQFSPTKKNGKFFNMMYVDKLREIFLEYFIEIAMMKAVQHFISKSFLLTDYSEVCNIINKSNKAKTYRE